MKVRAIILAVLLVGIGYTFYSNFFAEKKEIKVNSQAPDFELVDLNGTTHKLSDYRGRGVILNFWATWCEPCKREFPIIEQYSKSITDVVVLAVNIGEAKVNVENFVKTMNLTFPVLIDNNENSVMNAYYANNLPATFVIDKNGIIVDMSVGSMDNKTIEKHFELVK